LKTGAARVVVFGQRRRVLKAVGRTLADRFLHRGLTTSVSMPLLVVLVLWLTVIFISFGLFAPFNGTVIASLFVSALGVSGAIFLILEMYERLHGSDPDLQRPVARHPRRISDSNSRSKAERSEGRGLGVEWGNPSPPDTRHFFSFVSGPSSLPYCRAIATRIASSGLTR
jgi:hypothetical protein